MVITAIQLHSVSIVPKEQAPVYLIGGKRMWYPIGSEKPVVNKCLKVGAFIPALKGRGILPRLV